MQASPAEMQSLQSLFGAREDALRTGIVLQNKRYEVRKPGTQWQLLCCFLCTLCCITVDVRCWQVHRHHPEGPDPLVYGRTMVGDPELSEGAAVHMLASHHVGGPIVSVVTYE